MPDNHDLIMQTLLEIKEFQGSMKGSIDARLISIETEAKKTNGRVTTLEKKDAKLDIIFGKVGVVVALVSFLLASGFSVAIEGVKHYLFNKQN